jgi:Mg-chelatase subunit ChlD
MKKAILFGLLGALGCFIAAFGGGEPLWKYLTPPPPKPNLFMTASPSVTVEQGETNRFTVMIVRERFDGPVIVRCSDQPQGVAIKDVTIPAGALSQEMVVAVQDTALAGLYTVNISASSPDQPVIARTQLELRINPIPKAKVDVLFVVDVTASMQWAIDGIRQGILAFAHELDKPRLDARVGILAYRDDLNGESATVLRFRDGPFTNDYAALSEQMRGLTASGGGDDPESTLDALELASRQTFRPDATRVILLITDDTPHIPDARVSTMDEAIANLRRANVNQVHLVVRENHQYIYAPLQRAFEGQFFDLNSAAVSGNAFASILPGISREIARVTIASQAPSAPKVTAAQPPVEAIQSSKQFAAESSNRLVLIIGLWTAVLALGVTFALIIAQNIYLRRAPVGIGETLKGLIGSLAAGGLAGVAGQLLFAPLSSLPGGMLIARIAGWALLGLLLGGGMSFVVPNLPLWRGLLGGCLGGSLGSLGFFFAAQSMGENAGRVTGAALLGGCIGLMVALVEVLFREAWLEIQYGPKEIRTIGLGAEPIVLGSNQQVCTVYAKNAPPIAYRYWLKNNAVFCEDVPGKRTSSVASGDRKQIGNLVATVCSPGATTQQPQAAPALVRQSGHGAFSLRLTSGMSLDLNSGATVGAKDIPGLHSIPPGGPVGEVKPHPTDPNIQGLQNLSHLAWRVYLPNGDSIEVKPGKNVRLAAGTRIDFGVIQGEIRR